MKVSRSKLDVFCFQDVRCFIFHQWISQILLSNSSTTVKKALDKRIGWNTEWHLKNLWQNKYLYFGQNGRNVSGLSVWGRMRRLVFCEGLRVEPSLLHIERSSLGDSGNWVGCPLGDLGMRCFAYALPARGENLVVKILSVILPNLMKRK